MLSHHCFPPIGAKLTFVPPMGTCTDYKIVVSLQFYSEKKTIEENLHWNSKLNSPHFTELTISCLIILLKRLTQPGNVTTAIQFNKGGIPKLLQIPVISFGGNFTNILRPRSLDSRIPVTLPLPSPEKWIKIKMVLK